MTKDILGQLNVFSICRKYGLSLWQCPQFLFLVMGIIIITASIFSYLIGAQYVSRPEVVILIVLSIATILFVISYIITRNFERLAEVSRMKSEFINIVSHQLRSPLTNIKWTFELLTSKELDIAAEKVEEYMSNVKDNVARMVELIDDLLIVSRIEQGKIPMRKKETALSPLINDLVSRYKVFAEASHIELNFYCQKNMSKIFVDPSLIKLVVENLIDNAIRYTRGGGKVQIQLKKEGKNILFSIKDTGVGIPKKEQRYIFQKFFRAENALKERTRGSGLGLYVCRSIIKRAGGRIWFDSREGEGTTFYFTLPEK